MRLVVRVKRGGILVLGRGEVKYARLLLCQTLVNGVDCAVNYTHELYAAGEEGRAFYVFLCALKQLFEVQVIHFHQVLRQVEGLHLATLIVARLLRGALFVPRYFLHALAATGTHEFGLLVFEGKQLLALFLVVRRLRCALVLNV